MSNVVLPGATARIGVDASGVARGVNQANSAFGILERTVATNWWGLRNLGMAFAALPALVGAGMVASVRATMAWEDAMAGVERTTYQTGLSAEENAGHLANLEQQLLDLAKVKPLPPVELVGIAESAGALGVAREDIIRFTKATADLAATTDLTSDAAATALARIAGLTGVTAAGYDNLASAILDAGRSTAATETEIVSTATRLAGVASVVGLTADEVVGISAALQSVGIKSQAGGTAIQRTFIDIMQAITANGEEVKVWASLTNESVGDFAASFKADAAGTLARITESLGAMAGQGVNTTAVLERLGITEARQVQALLSLSAGQNSAVDSGFRLTDILEDSKKSMEAGTSAAQIAGKRYETFSAAIQLLKNELFALGVVIGKDVVPYLRPAVEILSNFIKGLSALPGPVRGAIGVVVGLITVVSGFGAILLLVVPRMVLMAGAMRELTVAARVGVGPLANHTRALDANAAAAARTTKAHQTAAAAMKANMFPAGVQVGPVAPVLTSKGNVNTAATAAKQNAVLHQNKILLDQQAAATTRAGVAADVAAPKVTRLSGSMGKMVRVGGVLGGVLTAATVGLVLFGSKVGDAEAAAEKATAANADLVIKIREQTKGVNAAADEWIKLELAQRGVIGTAEALGYSQQQLMDIVKGNVSQGDIDAFAQRLKAVTQDGRNVEGTRELSKAVGELFTIFRNSKEEAGAIVRQNGAITESDEILAAAMEETAEKAKEKADALNDQAQAHLDYIQSVMGVLQAEVAVADALREYDEAQKKAARTSEDWAEAQRDVEDALRSVDDAQRSLIEATRDLNEARARGIEELADAEDALANSRDQYLDGLEDIAKLEEDLAELRMGPAADDLRKALNKLRDANLDLVKSTQKVEDAEWQVQYLREEGASGRDISDAELALTEARDDVLDASDNLLEAEDELKDLRDDAARQKLIEGAERDLAAARRNSLSTLRDIGEQERTVNDIRAKIAADGYYKDALYEYESAQYRVRDALLAVQKAESDLATMRAGTEAQRDVRDAAAAAEAALFALAEQRVEQRKQAALMTADPKDDLDAADEAHALAEELSRLVDAAPTPEARKRLLDYIAILRKVPKTPPAPTMPPLPLPPRFPPNSGPQIPDNWIKPPKTSLIDQISNALGGPGGGALTGGLIGMAFGPVGALVGATIGFSIGGALRNWSEGKDIEESARNVLTGLLFPFTNFGIMQETLRRWVGGFIKFFKDLFGISSPSTVMAEIGRDVIRGFTSGISGLAETVRQKAGEIKKWVVEKFSDAGTWLWNAGYNILVGLTNGIGSFLGFVGEKLGEVKRKVTNTFSNAIDLLWNAGYDIVRGLWNGVVSAWDRIFKPLWNGLVDWLPGTALDAWKIGSPSKLFEEMGFDLILGLAKGLHRTGPVGAAMEALHEATRLDLGSLQDLAVSATGFDAGGLARATAATVASSSVINAPVTNYNFSPTIYDGPTSQEVVGDFFWEARVRTR